MSNSVTNLDLLSQSQAQKELTANALFDASSPATLYGRRASGTSGLTWAYYGGNLMISGVPTAIANGTITLADGTNCIQANPATGAVSVAGSFASGNIRLYTAIVSGGQVTSYTDHRTSGIGGSIAASGSGSGTNAVDLIIPITAEGAAFTVGTAKVTFRMPVAMTLESAKVPRASLSTAGSAITTIDIKINGTSIYGTTQNNMLNIDSGEKTSFTSSFPGVLSGAPISVPDDAEVTIDIVNAPASARGLKVTIYGTVTA